MRQDQTESDAADKHEGPSYRVRIPGFIGDQDIGLGDVIKRATSAAGIKPCRGCARRAEALNRWMVFSGKRQQQR
jgi:hypothetical protein